MSDDESTCGCVALRPAMQAPLSAMAVGRLQPQCSARSSRCNDLSPHLSEGKGSRVNVIPSEASPGVKFLQMKEKIQADVEALLDRSSGPKGTQSELTAARGQLRRRNGTCHGLVVKTCSPEYNKSWHPKQHFF